MFVANQLTNMNYNYDYDHDVLYLNIGTPTLSYGEEPYPGIYVNYSDSNDVVTGAIIMDFKHLDASLIRKHFPLNVEFELIKKELGINH